MNRSRLIQIGCVLLAIILLACGGYIQQTVTDQARSDNLLTDDNIAAMESNPELATMTLMPGGLRVLFVNYLWIRSQDAHQEGRHYDAFQLAKLICDLQPYHPGVWAFQSWNMAWNVSVTTFSPEQRWQWVYNGVQLLRDKGIAYNPKSIKLYKELSWIFVSKIAGQLDDYHNSYKARWAKMMQDLLGSPPVDDVNSRSLQQDTQLVIDSFKSIADAPLDRNKSRQGKELIQQDKLNELLQDPACKAYADKLGQFGITIGKKLLDAYNRYSMDITIQSTRLTVPALKTDLDKAVSAVINDPQAKAAREKMIAFVRGQLLWNEYRMDPQYMLELMQRYNAPLDWRHAMSSGLYWAAYGIDQCKTKDIGELVSINNARNVLNALKTLTKTGQVTLIPNPSNPDFPRYIETADLRFVSATQDQYMKFIELKIAQSKKPFEKNILKAGHVNYLVLAIEMLVADGREDDAQKYLEFLQDKYKKTGDKFDFVDVRQFALNNLRKEFEDRPKYDVATPMLEFALKRAYLSRGLIGGERGAKIYKQQFDFARQLYLLFQTKAVSRLKMMPFEMVASQALMQLMARPKMFGLALTVDQRGKIFRSMGDMPEMQAEVYIRIAPYLRELCKADGIDFDATFPKPAGADELKQKYMETMKLRAKKATDK